MFGETDEEVLFGLGYLYVKNDVLMLKQISVV